MSETVRLTKRQREALAWIRDHEPVSMFPFDGVAPSIRFVRKLRLLGLVEEVGKERGILGLTKFALTDAARAALNPER